jgi:hypothetical protein
MAGMGTPQLLMSISDLLRAREPPLVTNAMFFEQVSHRPAFRMEAAAMPFPLTDRILAEAMEELPQGARVALDSCVAACKVKKIFELVLHISITQQAPVTA